jgi:hypothetical protein
VGCGLWVVGCGLCVDVMLYYGLWIMRTEYKYSVCIQHFYSVYSEYAYIALDTVIQIYIHGVFQARQNVGGGMQC